MIVKINGNMKEDSLQQFILNHHNLNINQMYI